MNHKYMHNNYFLLSFVSLHKNKSMDSQLKHHNRYTNSILYIDPKVESFHVKNRKKIPFTEANNKRLTVLK